MLSNFPRCLAQILKHEGGFTKNPKDPGNWTGGKVGKGKLVGTKKGIAASANPGLDIPNLTDAQIAAIYRKNYFTPAGCEELPIGLDLAVFDPAVNAGVSRAKKWLAVAGTGTTKARIQKISKARLSFYRSLSTFKTFGKGWTRRVAEVEATAVSWALAAAGTATADMKLVLLSEAKKADKASKGNTKAATGAMGAGVGAPAVPTDSVLSPDLWPYVVVAVILACVVAALVYARRSQVNEVRADAYKEAARNV